MTDIDSHSPAGIYDPATHRMLSFHDAVARAAAFAFLNLQPARDAADRASARYKAGRPLGPVDGMPVGIKDLIETYDMPTEFGSELFRGHQPITDAAAQQTLREAVVRTLDELKEPKPDQSVA